MNPTANITVSDSRQPADDHCLAEVGIVVIGRNEGERLKRCLRSVVGRGGAVVYVDSGSTDGSVDFARSMAVEVVELDMATPFTAARARNAGLARLLEHHPDLNAVQFVDGDCELRPEWLARGIKALDELADVAAVFGRLRERFPEASIYNRLCDLEWDGPAGEAVTCGGIAMFRFSALEAVGGFDPTVAAGEEPELCLRLRRRGWKIVRLAEEMASHDAAIRRFGQWWKRAVRGGYGGLDIARRFQHREEGIFAVQIRSARLWGIAWPVAVVAAGVLGGLWGGTRIGLVLAAVVALAVPAQVLRLTIRTRFETGEWRPALVYGLLIMAAKWASLAGQWRYWRDQRSGRAIRLIEYKGPRGVEITGK